MSKTDIMKAIDEVTNSKVMTQRETVDFLMELQEGIATRIDDILGAMDLAKLPNPRAKSATRARAHEQVKTRFKIPKAKK